MKLCDPEQQDRMYFIGPEECETEPIQPAVTFWFCSECVEIAATLSHMHPPKDWKTERVDELKAKLICTKCQGD